MRVVGERSAGVGADVGADQAPGLVVDAGEDDSGAVRAAELEAAADLVDVAGQAAAADVRRADAELAQPGGEPLLVPRGGLDDAQRPREGRGYLAVGRQEGDPRVDLPRAEQPGEVLDEPRPGDRGAGVEQVLPWFADVNGIGVAAGLAGRAGSSRAARRSRTPATTARPP